MVARLETPLDAKTAAKLDNLLVTCLVEHLGWKMDQLLVLRSVEMSAMNLGL